MASYDALINLKVRGLKDLSKIDNAVNGITKGAKDTTEAVKKGNKALMTQGLRLRALAKSQNTLVEKFHRVTGKSKGGTMASFLLPDSRMLNASKRKIQELVTDQQKHINKVAQARQNAQKRALDGEKRIKIENRAVARSKAAADKAEIKRLEAIIKLRRLATQAGRVGTKLGDVLAPPELNTRGKGGKMLALPSAEMRAGAPGAFQNAPGFRGTRRASTRGKGSGALQSALISGAFPLLFGQGPLGGAAGFAGGYLGTKMGGQMGGFAGGLVATAALQTIQQAIGATAKLGQAFNKFNLDVNAITKSLGVTGTATAQYLKTLEAVKGPMAAANEAQERLKSIIGEKGVANLKEFGERSQSILNSTTKFFTTMTAGLAGILNFADKILGVSEGLKKGEIRQFAFNDDDPILKGLRSELAAIKSPKSTGILGPIGLKAIEDDKKRADILSKMLTRAEQVLTGTTAKDIRNNATMSLNKDIENLEKALSLGTKEAKIQKEIATILKEKNLERGKGQDNLIKEIETGVRRKTQLEEQLALWNQIKNTIATGLTNAITGLIEGTKTLGESLAGIAKQIANLILQKAILSAVDKAFTFGSGGVTTGETTPVNKFATGRRITNYATGGMATKPTIALVAEAGENEYVIPASKMAASMQRYSAGARGEAVIPGTGSSHVGAGGGASTTVNYSGPILNFNSEEFVPKSAVGQIIASATSQGARAGENRTLSTLRNSRSTRSRLGM